MKRFVPLLGASLLLSACAGRDAMPVTVSNAQDSTMNCQMIQAEMEANNNTLRELSSEKGLKVAQNVGAGVLGFFTFGLTWFAMDFKNAASTDSLALQNRNRYLGALAAQRC